MAVLKWFLLRKPQVIFLMVRIEEFKASLTALVIWCLKNVRMLFRYLRNILATTLTGFKRKRIANYTSSQNASEPRQENDRSRGPGASPWAARPAPSSDVSSSRRKTPPVWPPAGSPGNKATDTSS